MTSAKLLKIVFVILLLVIFGELMYYLYIQFYKEKYAQKSGESTALIFQKNNPSVAPTNPPNIVGFIKRDTNQYIQKHFNRKNHKVYLTIEVNGYVKEVKDDPTKDWFYISIVDDKGELVSTEIIEKEDLNFHKFYREEKGQKLPIKYSEIKKGEKTNIKVKSNLIDNSNEIEYLLSN
jgi:hypothetical protein